MQIIFALWLVLASFLPLSFADHDELGPVPDPLVNTLDGGEEPGDGDLGSGVDPLG